MADSSQQWPLYLRKMASNEISEMVQLAKIAVLPIGSIEQHGNHLPIDTDLTTVEYLAEQGIRTVRQAVAQPVALIAPSIPYGGPEIGMSEWVGTICLKPSTLLEVVADVGSGLIASGFRYVLLLNGCVGNIPVLTLATQKLKRENRNGNFLLVGSTWEMPEVINKVRTSAPGGLGHACELETSTSLVIDPDHVYLEKAAAERLKHLSNEITFDFDHTNPFYWPLPFGEMTQSGVIGDPTEASVEKGKVILEANIQRIADVLCHIVKIDEALSG